ncbi:protein-methionine-sulfoxide reductase heme-binding subunit MsrQ [Agaribacterium sp. ZY112]|uniref:protein-methionine-sulfoxide reductase heme-binding subunit MsrQ n=1 Tax=Agaribacterium sp. ZY112 TaxID=3233574 RepID=UPI0035263C79
MAHSKTAKQLAIGLQLCTHIACFVPLLWLFFAIPAGTLGGDPVKELIHFLGTGALRILLLCLAVSPLVKFLKQAPLMRLRRPLGLWAFIWASLHIFAWLAFDLIYDWSLIIEEVTQRTYIVVGFVAWLLLLMLSISSIPKLLRGMGKQWTKLHGSIYLIILLVCLHFWWSVKSGWIEPSIYFSLAVLLLVLRKKKIITWIKSFKSNQTNT